MTRLTEAQRETVACIDFPERWPAQESLFRVDPIDGTAKFCFPIAPYKGREIHVDSNGAISMERDDV